MISNSNLTKYIYIQKTYTTNTEGKIFEWGSFGNDYLVFCEPIQRNIIHSVSDKTSQYFGIAFENRDGTAFSNEAIELQIFIKKL